MKSIAVDAMGGDVGPGVTVPATVSVLKDVEDMAVVLLGDQDTIHRQLKACNHTESNRLRIQHTTEVVAMDEPPAHALRRKKDSSLRVAMNLVKSGDVKACVSAGNTGALMAIANFVLKTFPGINRPAIISQVPTIRGNLHILDLGANVDCSPEELLQFGIMGSTFVKYMAGIESPRVALLNIGIEDIKGNDAIKSAAKLFHASSLNYQGYIEGDAVFTGDVEVDVVVCDGFAGNIVIKTGEGVSKFIQHAIREEFQLNFLRKLAAIAAMPTIRGVKARIDPRVFNGAALIGLRGTVIKSHGGADTMAFGFALRKALTEIANDVPTKIDQEVSNATGALA